MTSKQGSKSAPGLPLKIPDKKILDRKLQALKNMMNPLPGGGGGESTLPYSFVPIRNKHTCNLENSKGQ